MELQRGREVSLYKAYVHKKTNDNSAIDAGTRATLVLLHHNNIQTRAYIWIRRNKPSLQRIDIGSLGLMVKYRVWS